MKSKNLTMIFLKKINYAQKPVSREFGLNKNGFVLGKFVII